MDDFELPLPGEYDDISRYEDEYADDFDALNDFEGELGRKDKDQKVKTHIYYQNKRLGWKDLWCWSIVSHTA